MRQALATTLGDFVECPHLGDVGLGQVRCLQRTTTRTIDPCIRRHAVEVFVGQQTLGQWREGNHTGAEFVSGIEQVFFHPAIEQVVGRLVNQQRHFPLFEQRRHFAGFHPGIGRDADVQRLALLHCGGECAGGFFQWGVRVKTVGVKDVDVVHAQALQALVEAGQHVLARTAALTVWTRPHVPTGLAGNDQLVAVLLEVFAQ
ncbi:hypothetical protein D3C84_719040 [compost metagenome]